MDTCTIDTWRQQCYIAQVTLVIPWLAVEEQAAIFPEGLTFSKPSEQVCWKFWLSLILLQCSSGVCPYCRCPISPWCNAGGLCAGFCAGTVQVHSRF